MAKINLNTLKSKFETGDKPTGQDYSDLIDTLAAQATDLGTSGNNESVVSGIENTTVLESIPVADWRLVKYMVSLSKTTDGANKFYATEFTVLIDGTNINIAQYGIIDNDGDIGTVDVSRVGSNLVLSIVPNPAVRPVTARFARVGLKA
jgi:hypothetical protein